MTPPNGTRREMGRMKTARDVIISEVGPRDGLQSIKRSMPTAAKIAWIKALAAAGLPEIEVGSFVSPRLLPQMADVAEVVAEVKDLPDVAILALVPNLKGAERAFAAGAHKVTMPVSASRAHSLANINMTPEAAVEAVAAETGLPTADPVRHGPDALLNALIAAKKTR